VVRVCCCRGGAQVGAVVPNVVGLLQQFNSSLVLSSRHCL
jgi:hypothetical protein